uniref:Uncharacterized protein n=1 Tax=Fagus sylvatica TaxID=28930 RepID=A0A2N9FFI1_FAGSY
MATHPHPMNAMVRLRMIPKKEKNNLKSTALCSALSLIGGSPICGGGCLRTASFWWVGGCGFAVCDCGGVGLRFAIVVVWVCVLGGCHGIRWRGFGFAGVGVGLPAWVVVGLGLPAWVWWVWVVAMGFGGVGLGLPAWVVVGLGLPAWVSWVWVGRRGCGFAGMGLRLA